MKFIQVQELSEIASLKVAVAICNKFEDCVPDKEDKTEIMHCVYNHWNFNVCDECLNKIKEMVSHLHLPSNLENKVEALCMHVYLQMCTWFNSLVQIHSKLMPVSMPRCSCLDQVDLRRYYEWKSIGIIDEKKTIENLIHDQRLDAQFRFVMACCFCFENDVRSLWDIMPEESKRNIRNHTSLPLISIWLKRLDGELDYGIGIVFGSFLGNHVDVFERFLRNATLLQYCLREVPSDLRKERLKFVACGIFRCHQVMRFCLFNMNDEEQEIIFQTNPHAVLCSFLDWPWQRHFMKVAFVTFDFLQEKSYFAVMWELWSKIACQWQDYDYIRLLTEFWSHSPTHLKEYMRREQTVYMERLIYCLKKNYNFHDFH